MTKATLTSDSLQPEAVFAGWQQQLSTASQVLVALSGGLDSTVLLQLLVATVSAGRVCAVHVNHGLSANADQWQAQAEDYCRSLGVQIHCETVEVTPAGEGIEAAARHARYAVFERLLQKDGLLLLGHHADDQVETLLYQMLRGSGAKGMSGMPVQRALGHGQLIRPLLSISKAQLKDYALIQNLTWCEDESNADDKFDRNYLRNQIVPVVAQRWPDYRQSIGLSAELSSEAEQLAAALAEEDFARLDEREERAGWSICVNRLLKLNDVRQRNILHHWPGLNNLAKPNKTIIAEIKDSVVGARDDGEPEVVWQSTRWRRFRSRLYLLRNGSAESCLEPPSESRCDSIKAPDFAWHAEEPLELADGSSLVAEDVDGAGLLIPQGQLLTVCYRRGGERCRPVGRGHSNSLKKLLLEYAVEPWWRDRMPLLYMGETLVAVGDCWICEGWQAAPQQRGKKIHWQVNSL